MTAAFGLFGYVLIKFGFEPAPLLLGFVLGRLMEEKLRQALVISRGSFETFVDRPLIGQPAGPGADPGGHRPAALHPQEPRGGVPGGD